MPATDCGIIILAAGSSSRLGKPKQLLTFGNTSLLQYVINEANACEVGKVVVVTGYNQEIIASSLLDNEVYFVYNENWQQGMASSIQAGLSALLSLLPQLSSVIIMLCDQPFVSSALLKEMIAKQQSTNMGIVACIYNETIGVPALFSHTYFRALQSLQGAEGAKKIITAYTNDVAIVPFPLGAVDIDTKEDYDQLIK